MAYQGVDLDYEEIERVCGLMTTAHDTILPVLLATHLRVSLLTMDGMVFENASEAIRNSYSEFDKGVGDAVRGIQDFSDMFRNIRKNAEEFDNNMAKSLNEQKD